MSWYEYRQNNTGGSFVFDHTSGVSVYVWIEADSARYADYVAEGLGLYFDGCDTGMDCSCCGDRWYSAQGFFGDGRPDSEEAPTTVEGYGNQWCKNGPEGYAHPLNGDFYALDYVRENI